jgi:hypothetical protein
MKRGKHQERERPRIRADLSDVRVGHPREKDGADVVSVGPPSRWTMLSVAVVIGRGNANDAV